MPFSQQEIVQSEITIHLSSGKYLHNSAEKTFTLTNMSSLGGCSVPGVRGIMEGCGEAENLGPGLYPSLTQVF